MCTVTFVKHHNQYIFTSNRDETTQRGRAIAPKEYNGNFKKLVYPKDPKANGTWIVHDYSNCAILLNGAEEKHIHRSNYRKSRGLILLDIFDSENVLEFWNTINLNNIEPFTIIIFFEKKLYQLQWNEIEKSTQEISTSENHIWSSSTLYSKEIRNNRKTLFKKHIETTKISPEQILKFHQFKDSNNTENTIIIKRNQFFKTVSITQFSIENNQFTTNYIDLYE